MTARTLEVTCGRLRWPFHPASVASTAWWTALRCRCPVGVGVIDPEGGPACDPAAGDTTTGAGAATGTVPIGAAMTGDWVGEMVTVGGLTAMGAAPAAEVEYAAAQPERLPIVAQVTPGVPRPTPTLPPGEVSSFVGVMSLLMLPPPWSGCSATTVLGGWIGGCECDPKFTSSPYAPTRP